MLQVADAPNGRGDRLVIEAGKPTGIIAAPDIAMLSSLRDRRQARQWARLHCGLAGLREMSGYQLAATELGLLHRQAERGLVDEASFGRRRDGLLAGMKTATPGLLGRLADPPRPPWAPQGPSCFRPPPARPAPPASRPDRPWPSPSRVAWTHDGAGPGGP